MPNEKGFAPLLIIILIVIVAVGGYFFYKNNASTYLNISNSPIPTQTSNTPSKSPVSKATPEGIWDPQGFASKTLDGITLFAKWSGFGDHIVIVVNIENRSDKKVYFYISAKDFILLDDKGNKIGTIVDGRENSFISVERMQFFSGQRLWGNISFVDVPDSFEKGTLRFQPEIDGAQPIDVPVIKPLLPGGR